MMRYVSLALVCLALPAAALAQDVPAVDFRPQWTVGQTARYSFFNRLDQTIESAVADRRQSQQLGQTAEGEITWTVDAVQPDGSTTNTMTLDWMTIDVSLAAGPQKQTTAADSRKPATGDAQPMYELLSAMAGTPLKVTLAPDGQVTKITGLAAIKAKTSKPALVPSDLDFEETATELAALAACPTRPVTPDASWKASFTWDHELGQMQQRWDYRFTQLETLGDLPLAVVTGQAKLKLDPELPADLPPNAPPVRIRLLSGAAATKIFFDPTRHEVVARHATNDEQIEVTVPLPNGQTFRRTITEAGVSQLLRISEK